MLIEFRVKNFRSIREEQCLSLVASKDKDHCTTHLASTGIPGIPHLVKSAVLYGANASGKSNIINALLFMKGVVMNSSTSLEGQKFNYSHFKLDAEFSKQPSEFEVTFVNQGVRYQYGFSLLPDRVAEEWLLVYKSAKPQAWFSRSIDHHTGKDRYNFSTHLTGQRKVWQESTRTNVLFLSKAVDLNSEQLRPIFLWFAENLMIIPVGHQPINDFSVEYAQTEEGKNELLKFLINADLSISNLSFEKKKLKKVDLHFGVGKEPSQQLTDVEVSFPKFLHQAEKGVAEFEFQDESTGTQKFFAFAGPILNVMKHGSTLVVDELDGSLHTFLVRLLIKYFHSSDINMLGSQLIFSTHDTALLDTSIFRRDQIWFVEKDRAQATKLYPLTQFSPRKNEALERGYLMGRYGAIPFFSNSELLERK